MVLVRFFYTHFAECIWGKHDYSKETEKGRFLLHESMALMEGWLSKTRYLRGDELSYADLQGYHEFVSHIAGAIIPAEVWKQHPALTQWCNAMGERPHAQSVNQTIMQVGQTRLAGELIPMQRTTSLAKGTEIVGGHTTGIPYLQGTQ